MGGDELAEVSRAPGAVSDVAPEAPHTVVAQREPRRQGAKRPRRLGAVVEESERTRVAPEIQDVVGARLERALRRTEIAKHERSLGDADVEPLVEVDAERVGE